MQHFSILRTSSRVARRDNYDSSSYDDMVGLSVVAVVGIVGIVVAFEMKSDDEEEVIGVAGRGGLHRVERRTFYPSYSQQ